MAVESTTVISGLVTTNPTSTDPVYQGPAHFQLIKRVLKNVFPGSGGNGFSKPITATEDEINYLSGVTSGIQTQLDAILGKVYPVGSIYVNADSTTNPATLLGFGTWARFGGGKVLVSQLDGDAIFGVKGNTGGSKDAIAVAHTHTATAASGGTHDHGGATASGGGTHSHTGTAASGGAHTHTGTTDTGGAHSHTYNEYNQLYSVDASVSPGGSLWRDTNTGTTTSSGSHNHTFTTDSGGAHTHTVTTDSASTAHTHTLADTGTAHTHTLTVDSAGASGANANMPPYVVVYMWRRTA